jgi:hypothetical protein
MTEAAIKILQKAVLDLRSANVEEMAKEKPDEEGFEKNKTAIAHLSMLLIEDEFEKNPLR